MLKTTKGTYTFIFFLSLLVRVLFKILSGFDNYILFVDSHRYDRLSSQIVSGNYNMDIVAYLCAPLYPYTLALFKAISSQHWEILVVGFQFILVSLSAVYIYKIAQLLFKNHATSLLAALIYIFYPLTLWYNFTFIQETCFQAYFIFFLFHFLNAIKSKSLKPIIYSSIFFALAALTKSHILILGPFLAIMLLMEKKFRSIIYFAAISFFIFLPHGILNKKMHDVFTLSSHGNASFFLLGHSDQTYNCIMETAGDMGSISATGCDPSFVMDKNYIFDKYGAVNKLSVKDRNSVRLQMGIEWIRENPAKFFKLKVFCLKRFLLPGLDRQQYNWMYWLMSFIAGIAIYIPAYLYLLRLRKKWRDHLLVLSLIIITGAIFTLFFPVNRFRVITLEPMLMVYAAPLYYRIVKKWFPNLIPETTS